MSPETKEYIYNESRSIIIELLIITDKAILTPEEEALRERAESWLSYTGQHYK